MKRSHRENFPLHSNWTLNILNPEIIRVSNCESRCDEKRKEVTRETRYIKEQQVYYKFIEIVYFAFASKPRLRPRYAESIIIRNSLFDESSLTLHRVAFVCHV